MLRAMARANSVMFCLWGGVTNPLYTYWTMWHISVCSGENNERWDTISKSGDVSEDLYLDLQRVLRGRRWLSESNKLNRVYVWGKKEVF